jgi:hypothetical protein
VRAGVPDLDNYRLIDAETIKRITSLSRRSRTASTTGLLAETLADGHTVAPRELAALVHRESV